MYIKISEYIPPWIDTAIGNPTTGRVALITFSIQQTMRASAKFSYFRKNISNLFKCHTTKISKPIYNIIMKYYTAYLQHDIQC